MKNKHAAAIISIVFVMIIWGGGSAVTKAGVEEVPPFYFALVRNAIASFFLFLMYWYRRRTGLLPYRPQLPYKKIIWMGLTGITFFYLFFNISLVYTSAASGALLQGFIPAVIVLLAIFFLKEKLEKQHIIGVILSMIGVLLIGFVNTDPQTGNSLLGNALMIGSVLSWAVYTIISKSMHQHDAVAVTAFSTLAGTILLIPVVVVEQWGQPLPAISWNAWTAILYLSILSSTISYVLYNRALKTLSATTVGNFLNLDPVVGVIIAIIFLKEKITMLQIVGGVLVLIGIVLSTRPSGKKAGIANASTVS